MSTPEPLIAIAILGSAVDNHSGPGWSPAYLGEGGYNDGANRSWS